MTKRSLLSLVLVLCMVFGLMVPAIAEEGKETLDLAGKLVILHTNDVHGRAVTDSSTGALGYAFVAQKKDDFEAAGASVLLLDAGDATQGMSSSTSARARPPSSS